MMLEKITPVLLTYNEAPNIGRTLSLLTWAKEVIVVDSGSTDSTLDIARNFTNVRMFVRQFDTHGSQWHYAVTHTGIATPWILRLDADYLLSPTLLQEISTLDPEAPVSAYRIEFDYAIFSRNLRASLYPSNTILLRRDRSTVWDNGHSEAWNVVGPIARLKGRVIHDDWKKTEVWLSAQGRYMRLEMERLVTRQSRLRDRVRLWPPIMPFAVFLYCLFGKGLILNGRAGLFYALQRMTAEAALSLMILESKLRAKANPCFSKEEAN